MINAKTRILEAAVDPDLRAAAIEHWARVAPGLLVAKSERVPEVSLRASDAGTCVRKLWHALHGNPEVIDAETMISRLDIGTVYGAWLACLLTASLERDFWTVECEPEVNYQGIAGHIDVYYEEPKPAGIPREADWFPENGVIEFKTTYGGFELSAPDARDKNGTPRAIYQVYQAATYAAAKNAREFAIVTFGPAVPNRRGIDPSKIRQDDYETADWLTEMSGEWERLFAALGDVEPVEDAKETWRCRGCAVTACERWAAQNKAAVTA